MEMEAAVRRQGGQSARPPSLAGCREWLPYISQEVYALVPQTFWTRMPTYYLLNCSSTSTAIEKPCDWQRYPPLTRSLLMSKRLLGGNRGGIHPLFTTSYTPII